MAAGLVVAAADSYSIARQPCAAALHLHACMCDLCAWSTRSSLTYHEDICDLKPDLPQYKHLVMHSKIFSFPPPVPIAMHIGDRRDRGGGLGESRFSVVVCVHFISMQKCGLVKRGCKLRLHSTSESQI
jgi:hypothetical protein